ncbi:hypothetical protein K9B35_14615 [Sphingomonas sp. R647]|uniref:hypothetical protein n=1 Tax=Sphingomonas sp. R647 TaxID=2875233 RepID=UPI001CD439E0|nr:hypothetical protein [Sphingomonas sp. R647]MCA1199207.1 hypothetical protein [Sphingomonas sp. R647]
MRIDLQKPITLPRWQWLMPNLTAMIFAMIVLLKSDAFGSFQPTAEPVLLAIVGMLLIAAVVVLVAAFKAQSSN